MAVATGVVAREVLGLWQSMGLLGLWIISTCMERG
jgi:hypothetical protein